MKERKGKTEAKPGTAFRAAAYIRLSREDGDKAESDSVSNQRKLLEAYVKDKEEFSLYDTYIDDGYTGTDFIRPGFLRMLEDIEAGAVNCVIVKDLSRFGRDYIETGNYLERRFPQKGVRFISVADHIDSGRQAYDMLLPLKNIFNEQYARDISQKVRAAMRAKQNAGEFIGAFAPYGYRKSPGDKNRLVIDEYAAEVVRRIFRMYGSGIGKNRIAAQLNKEGILCPSAYKRQNGEAYQNGRRLEKTSYWTYSTVHRLLQSEVYAGNMAQGKKSQRMRGRQRTVGKEDWIIVSGTHEAVIDKDTWEKTRRLLGQRAREPGMQTKTALFAGFLKCGDCGRAMVKKTGSKAAEPGSVCYYCGTYMRSGRQYCTPHKTPQAILEKILSRDLAAVLERMGEGLKALIDESRVKEQAADAGLSREQERLKKEMQRLGKRKKELYEDYRESLLSREEYLAYLEDCRKREEGLSQRISGLQKAMPPEREEEIPALKRFWEQRREPGLSRGVLAEMVQEITVYEGRRLEMRYRFSVEGAFPVSELLS